MLRVEAATAPLRSRLRQPDSWLPESRISAWGGKVACSRRLPGTNVGAPGQYRLDATIDDRRSGERLWQGWTTAPLIRSDGQTLSMSMVPVMVESVGSTVKRKPFVLP